MFFIHMYHCSIKIDGEDSDRNLTRTGLNMSVAKDLAFIQYYLFRRSLRLSPWFAETYIVGHYLLSNPVYRSFLWMYLVMSLAACFRTSFIMSLTSYSP